MADVKETPSLFQQLTAKKGPRQAAESGMTGGVEKTSRQMIAEASAAVKAHISRQPHVQRLFSFMPTLMTRVSPFHFRNPLVFKDWPLVRLDSGDTNSWGRMTVVGELLVIFDETVLFCLLALMRRCRSDAFETAEADICELAGINPSTNTCNAVWKSIQRLTGTRIDLSLLSGKGKKRRAIKQMTGSILTYCDRDAESGAVRVAINPYFLEMYGESFVTNIDMGFRASLKSDIAKALYRFFQGQVGADEAVSLRRMARSINLNMDSDPEQVTKRLKKGLRELKERDYLETFQIDAQGGVSIHKAIPTEINPANLVLG